MRRDVAAASSLTLKTEGRRQPGLYAPIDNPSEGLLRLLFHFVVALRNFIEVAPRREDDRPFR